MTAPSSQETALTAASIPEISTHEEQVGGTASLDRVEAMTMSPASVLTPDQALAQNLEKSSTDYRLPRCAMPPPSELQPIDTFVMNAIQSQHNTASDPAHQQGYKAIMDALRRPVDLPMLRMLLISLRTAGNGTALSLITTHASTHAQLIHWLFRFNSAKRPQVLPHDEENERLCEVLYNGNLLDAHLHLILAMVSARASNLIPALTAVWKMLSENVSLHEEFQYRLHSMICTMLRLVPKARTDLYPIIASRFPFWMAEKRKLKWYCIQSLRVLDYLPSIRKFLLEFFIDKCLEIDVNIKIDENGEVSIEKEEEANHAENDAEKKCKDEAQKETETKKNGVNVDVMSDTLDSLLAVLLRTLCVQSKDGVEARTLYYEVLPVFESTIITTHKSKFVQYCIFLLCGLEAEEMASAADASTGKGDQQNSILHRDFASKLLEIIMDPYRATLTRQSAACYLASFVSRASYVEAETVCEAISALLRWAEAYMDSLAVNSIRAADSREQGELHSLFYTVCQAAFYIMCFRGNHAISFYQEVLSQYNQKESDKHEDRILLPDPNEINLGSSRWTHLCNHQLQPLRFCLESVRSEFLHVAHFYDLIDEPILVKLVEDAKRMSTGRVNKKAASTIMTAATLEKQRRKGGVGGLGRGSNPLKSFFPFDPLLLRRSHAFIEPFYKHWQGPVEDDDILVIDEAPDDVEQIFEMDEETDNDDDQDVAPVIVSDQEIKNDEADSDSDDDASSHDIAHKKEEQKEAWAKTLKRPRSQSMENGSW